MNAADILSQASSLVSGDRNKQHGDKLENHQNIAALWSAYKEIDISPRDVAIMMALLKIARTKTGEVNADDFVDGCGYISIAGELASPHLERDSKGE